LINGPALSKFPFVLHTRFTRFSLSLGLLAAAIVGFDLPTLAAPAPALKDAFQGDFLVGVEINRSVATATPNARRDADHVKMDSALVKTQFNQISPENDLKWALIHPREGANGYDFAPADAYVKFGIENHLTIIGHTLVWHGQTPRWVFQSTRPNQPHASREELLERMREHILTVVGRYKGKIKVWDVVNEALSDGGPDLLRRSPWSQIIGPDFIARAFEYAHEADPDAILRYNDYGLENLQKRQKLITLIKSLQAQNVPVMAIGTQTHVSVSSPSFAEMDRELTDLETLGLPIHITELDVNSATAGQRDTGADLASNAATTNGGLVEAASERLARQYASLFKAFLQHRKSVKMVTFWGVNDAVSWRANGKPLLFDGDDQPKPAFEAVIQVAAEKNSSSN
jgi:endo-1,4-beta-xylanase